MNGKTGPNWLLRSLILFSVAIHGLVFIHLSGIHRSSTLTAIELSLQAIDRPAARDIPRPRPRPNPPVFHEPQKQLSALAHPLPDFKPLAVAPLESDLPDSAVETIRAPEIPPTPAVDSDWTPSVQARETNAELMTTAAYLDMVRLKIESRKRYPAIAKARNMQGRVTVRFVLTTDGSVRDVAVITHSPHKVLDQAAMEAVRTAAPFPRPPSTLFDRDLPLELTIVFELT
jgi:periplasmic protein TonB